MLRRMAFSLIAFVAVARLADAQWPEPPFRVNTYTIGDQVNADIAASIYGVTVPPYFVAVWRSHHQDGYNGGVFGQRYDRLGSPQGSEFAVNTYTMGDQSQGRVAVLASGDFVVTWTTGFGQDGDGYGIWGRRYDVTGNPAGSEFRVNSFYTGYQLTSAVAPTAGGGFVVVWASYGQEGPDAGVFGQIFDASGGLLGAEFHVNTYTTGYQLRPAVATAPSGDFVVVWTSGPVGTDTGQDGSEAGIFGQRFNAAGALLGAEFQVNTSYTAVQDDADVGMDASGNFVVVWNSLGQDGSDYGVVGQRFDAAGNSLGSEFGINTYTTNGQEAPSIAGEPDGRFVVSWTSSDQVNATGAYDDIFAQRFGPTGAKVGPEFLVNSYTTAAQFTSAVASLGEDTYVMLWVSNGQDGDGLGVYAQHIGDLIFANGFNAEP